MTLLGLAALYDVLVFIGWYLNHILTDCKSEVPLERSFIIPYYSMSTETISSG
jgi:hypothetical protein